MTVTFDTPDSIPMSKVRQFLADLGIPAGDLVELQVGIHGVHAEYYAHDEDGHRYVWGDGTVATHVISIPLDRDA